MEQTYEQALEFVHNMPPFSSKPGLKRIENLLSLLGNPQKKLKFIHIAGTNGKGSVSAMCATCLEHAGYKTGLYISPFVVDFRERFQINGKMISKADFLSMYKTVKNAYIEMTDQGWECNEYDFITALAMLYFNEKDCDIVCLEVGLGGGMDATNIIDPPQVSIITKISYDHIAVLGDTIQQIASEKAGIIKSGSACICYPEQDEEALAVLMERCAKVGTGIILPNSHQIDIMRCDQNGSAFVYGGEQYSLLLIGRHQIMNAVTAIEALKNLPDFKLSDSQIKQGLSKVAFPGRMEKLSTKPIVIIDGAHNPDGIKNFCQTIDLFDYSPKIAVIGMVRDKDWENAILMLQNAVDIVIATEPNNPRKLPSRAMAEYSKDIICCPEYSEAVAKAVDLAGKGGGVFVCGSLFLVSDVRRMFLSNDDN